MAYFPMIVVNGMDRHDFFDVYYTSSSKSTYTFTQDLEYCYVCSNSDTPLGTGDTDKGKLTPTTGSSAVMTKVYTPPESANHWGVINLIENVKAGDKYTCPAFTVAGNARSCAFLLGRTKPSLRSQGNKVIQVKATTNSSDPYYYKSGVNTFTFNKADFGIGSNLEVDTICFLIRSGESNFGTGWYFVGTASEGKYINAVSSSSAGQANIAMAYPATSSNKLGYQETSDTVSISMYESGSSVSGRVADIIITFKESS